MVCFFLIQKSPMDPSFSQQNFAFLLQILSVHQQHPHLSIADLARLYCTAFTTSRKKKINKEQKKCLMTLLNIMERLFGKAYYEFVRFFFCFLKPFRKWHIFLRLTLIGASLRIFCLISQFSILNFQFFS